MIYLEGPVLIYFQTRQFFFYCYFAFLFVSNSRPVLRVPLHQSIPEEVLRCMDLYPIKTAGLKINPC